MIRNLKFRIYPTKKQTTQLINCLEESRYVYNLLLEKRKIEWESNRKSIHVYEQINCLPEIKLDRPSVKVVYSQCLQNIAVRIDLAYQAFFRNLKKDPQKAGLPRPKDKGKYSSITFPQYNSGCKIINNKLRLFKIGDVHIKLHRKIENIKTITIKYEPTGKWFAIIACDVESVRKGGKQKTVGIDLGTMTFATLSDEEEIKNPRFLDRALKEIAKLDRRFRLNPSKKNRHSLAIAHEKIKNRRSDFHHKESSKLVSEYSQIFAEDLDIGSMLEKHWISRQISDAGWYNFISAIEYKSAEAGIVFKKVEPAYTSQDCSRCGHREFKKLNNREHSCKECGLNIGRDLNAAINIKTRGLASLAKA